MSQAASWSLWLRVSVCTHVCVCMCVSEQSLLGGLGWGRTAPVWLGSPDPRSVLSTAYAVWASRMLRSSPPLWLALPWDGDPRLCCPMMDLWGDDGPGTALWGSLTEPWEAQALHPQSPALAPEHLLLSWAPHASCWDCTPLPQSQAGASAVPGMATCGAKLGPQSCRA